MQCRCCSHLPRWWGGVSLSAQINNQSIIVGSITKTVNNNRSQSEMRTEKIHFGSNIRVQLTCFILLNSSSTIPKHSNVFWRDRCFLYSFISTFAHQKFFCFGAQEDSSAVTKTNSSVISPTFCTVLRITSAKSTCPYSPAFLIFLSFLCLCLQRCYEHKQYRNGLKFCKQILSNPKFAEHGGKTLLSLVNISRVT